ncbi:unnamed protein product [Brachionus calyciflorus]|uniref:B box-type domain-containing protein n=1 Tax=Brachionus calyciflorus TaxID=104777 RepID=A0A814H2K7_9BILA|nr:unnamed protein product [Brachionus calyciflorus]
MINYGGSIKSAFPNTFCSSPSNLSCNICNSNLNETDSLKQKSFHKCTHCGVNICESCFLENQEAYRAYQRHQDFSEENNHQNFFYKFKNSLNSKSMSHYNVVKKEFKQMYNYSKTIVEKLHLLNNTIKIEESTVSDLNLIKHQVNTKALELIKQINQEKSDLLDQIENVKRKYEMTLNERKEYFALSMQYKDELRKVIRKYKEFKSEEKCSLSDLLSLYFSVKNISKNLDDYDHIKLIAEQDPLKVKFEERPIYRNLIGKLILNQSNNEFSNEDSDNKLHEHIQMNQNSKRHSLFEKNSDSSFKTNKKHLNKISKSQEADLDKDLSRSFSLNDLINAATELIASREKDFKMKNEFKSTNYFNNNSNVNNSASVINKGNKARRKNYCQSEENDQTTDEEFSLRNNKSHFENTIGLRNHNSCKQEKYVPSVPPITQTVINDLNKNFEITKSLQDLNEKEKLKSSSKILIDGTSYKMRRQESSDVSKSIDEKNPKLNPKKRLEIDILPSHLSCNKTKLLISSSYGKIRTLDLYTNKMQKDELKNLLINGICMPKSKNDDESDILYALTNAQMSQNEDVLNVSNSVIIVSKRELRILKIEGTNPNEDYIFSNPSGICFDIYNNLYVCDSGYNRVKIFDTNLGVIKILETAENVQDRLSQPKSVSTHQDVLFICDSANHRIVTYHILDKGKDFKFRSVYGFGYGDDCGMLKYPQECCADSNGVLYVRDHHNNRVQLFDSNGQPLQMIEVNTPRETIYSMTVNQNGDIFIAKMVQDQEKIGKINTINKYYIDIY